MPARVIFACLMCALFQMQLFADGSVAAVRFAHFEVLTQQYVSAANQVGQSDNTDLPRAERERSHMELCRSFAPKFLALAQEDPEDEAALRCCEWVIAHCRSHVSSAGLYEAEAVAWSILQSNRTACDRLPAICLEASRHPSPAREKFLRALPQDYRQPVEVHGYAYLALAELLVNKQKMRSEINGTGKDVPADWREYIASGEQDKILHESFELYRHVLSHYAEIPIASEMEDEGAFNTLGEWAAQRLSNLNNPQLAREALPNVIEIPGERFDYLSGN